MNIKINKKEILIMKDVLEPLLYSQKIFLYETVIIKTLLDLVKAHIHNYTNAETSTAENNHTIIKKAKIKKKPTFQEILKQAKACNKKPLPKKCLLRKVKKSTVY